MVSIKTYYFREKKLKGFGEVASKADVFLTYAEVGIAGQHNPCRD
jgi:hypothetical protein